MATKKGLTPTRSTLSQMGQAAAAFIRVLGSDPRVQAAYNIWRDRQSGRTAAALTASVIRNKSRDLAELQRFVRRDLQLDHAGVVPLLHVTFGLTLSMEVSGQQTGRLSSLSIAPNAPLDVPPGRAAKNRGRHIERDVEWFYRAKIKRPRDSPYKIAKEHAQRQRSAGVWTSVVDNGIARAEQLLEAFDVDGEPLI